MGSQLLQTIYDLLRGESQQGSMVQAISTLVSSQNPKEQELGAYLTTLFGEDLVLDDP